MQDVSAYLNKEADSLELSVLVLANQAEKGASPDSLFKAFAKARKHFKHIEPIVVFYFPEENKRINGPAIVKAEEYDDKVVSPTGFQVIEETLYAAEDSIHLKELASEALNLHAILGNLKRMMANSTFTDKSIFEAIRLEMLTLSSLGITGFDSPISFQSLAEAREALKGVETVADFYQGRDGHKDLQATFDAAYQYLMEHPDFDSFDRATFITRHLNKLSVEIYHYQQALHIPNNTVKMALNMDVENFFQADAFIPDFFVPGYNRNLRPEVADLGRMLFFDPVLSGNNSRACSSCHNPDKAFSDGQVKSVAFNFQGQVTRNAPTLINSIYQRSQFWDQRVHVIEDQITDVMANPLEMHGGIQHAPAKLEKSAAYQKLFQDAFGGQKPITDRNIQSALATYIRSLRGLNSRFDQFIHGDSSTLNADELVGFNLFMGKAKCGTCHFAPLFNGTAVPLFNDTESEVLGVPQKPDTTRAVVDADLGKYNITKREPYKHAFKTPTVRNAALTAPYMHNGVYRTLEEVVDFYNRGGGAGIGIQLSNQTLPPDELHLSAREQRQIVAFINTLTDTTGITKVPAALPAFGDKGLDQRKIGGKY